MEAQATRGDDLDGALEVFEASQDANGEKDAAQREAAAQEAAAEESDFLLDLAWTSLFTASGGEPETNLQLDDLGFRTEDLLRARDHKAYPSMAIALNLEWAIADWLLLRSLLDTREIRDGSTLEPPLSGLTMNGNPVEEEIRDGSYIRELSATMGHDAVTVEIGRFRAQVADGLVYDDFGGGIRVRADLEDLDIAPMFLEALVGSVGQRVRQLDNNPLLSLRLDWNLSPFEFVGVFVAFTRDDNGEISEVLRSAYAENLLDDQRALSGLFLQEQGSGGHAYLGAIARIITADAVSLKARAVLSGGELRMDVPPSMIEQPEDLLEGEPIDVRVSGYALDVELHYGLSDRIDLAGYAFVLSGDEPPRRDGDRYRSFIGLAPYWVWSGLFFSGGLNQGLYPNRSAAAGVNGRGVAGGGPGLEYEWDPLRAETRLLLLSAVADAPAPPRGGEGRLYGIEWDVQAEWSITPWLGVGIELDLLLPGDFFPDDTLSYLALVRATVRNAR